MALTLEQYAQFLDTRGLNWPEAPTAVEPRAKAHLVYLPHVRMVTWNIYGTLLCIRGGELYFEHPDKFVMDLALEKTVHEFKMWQSMSRKPGQPGDYLGQMYRDALTDLRMAGSAGEKYPEILAEKVWEFILTRRLKSDYKYDIGMYGNLSEYAQKIAYFFHASLQGTACYAGAAHALEFVKSCGLQQGVIADAQSFTMLQLKRGLAIEEPTASLDGLIDIDLRSLSFEQRARKPSERLFRPILEAAARRGLAPRQVLHIGSRLAVDLAPARKAGMTTALFAGDKQSLQGSRPMLKDPATRPDVLLTDLAQVRDLLSPD